MEMTQKLKEVCSVATAQFQSNGLAEVQVNWLESWLLEDQLKRNILLGCAGLTLLIFPVLHLTSLMPILCFMLASFLFHFLSLTTGFVPILRTTF